MPGEGSPALRWGLTGAIGLTIVGILAWGPILLTGNDLLGGVSDREMAGAAAFYLTIGCLSLIAYPAILIAVGILAARGTGRTQSGATAGAIAMMFSNLIILLVEVFAPARESANIDLSDTGTGIAFITSYAFCSLPMFLTVAAMFGAGVGSLGGLIGRLFYHDPLEDDDQMPMDVAHAQYLGILPVSGAPPMPPPPGAPYPGIPYPPPPQPVYPPHPEHPLYPPGYHQTGAPVYPYPPAQFAPPPGQLPPPGAFPPPMPYPPYAPPPYGSAPPPSASSENAFHLYVPPEPPDFTGPSVTDDATPSDDSTPGEAFQPEPPPH